MSDFENNNETEDYPFVEIENLIPFQKRFTTKFYVLEKGERRAITSKRTGETYDLADIKVADETGTIILSLWSDDIDLVEEEKTYLLKNGKVNVIGNSMRLAKGKYGKIEKVDEDEAIEEVNTENNISEKHVERPRRRRSNRRRRKNYDNNRNSSYFGF